MAAQAAAVEALRHQDEVERSAWRDARRARRRWSTACARSGLWVAESDANFIWCHLDDAAASWAAADGRTFGGQPALLAAYEKVVVDGLRERGVLVRAGAALGRAGAMRVTVGTPWRSAERFTDALRRSCV